MARGFTDIVSKHINFMAKSLKAIFTVVAMIQERVCYFLKFVFNPLYDQSFPSSMVHGLPSWSTSLRISTNADASSTQTFAHYTIARWIVCETSELLL